MAEDNELREAAATPLPAAMEVDDDIANVPQATGDTGSPTKRARWDERPAGPGITLADLTAALAPLAAGMHDLPKEGFKDMRARMSAVEEQVTAKVGQALDMVKKLNDRQQANPTASTSFRLRSKNNKTVTDRRRTPSRKSSDGLTSWNRGRPLVRFGAHNSLRATPLDVARAPALILGRWDESTEADDIVRVARNFADKAQLDVDMSDAFSPGRQRGFP